MTGEYRIYVKSKSVVYDFSIRRKITVIVGDSGSGKTRFVSLLKLSKMRSKVRVECDADVVAVDNLLSMYKLLDTEKENKENGILNKIIYVLDEDVCNEILREEKGVKFARAIKEAYGYFILMSRRNFGSLPYSVQEIFELSNKLGSVNLTEYTANRVYTLTQESPIKPDYIITEDEKVGYRFYKDTLKDKGVVCISAKSKDKIVKTLLDIPDDFKTLVIIADGAAFGSNIEGVLDIVDFKLRGKVGRKIRILLPESFEYIILASGIIKVDKTKLVETYNFAESSVYFSWERYYTELLEDESNGMYKKDKNAIPMFLRNPINIKKFYDFVKEVDVC